MLAKIIDRNLVTKFENGWFMV